MAKFVGLDILKKLLEKFEELGKITTVSLDGAKEIKASGTVGFLLVAPTVKLDAKVGKTKYFVRKPLAGGQTIVKIDGVAQPACGLAFKAGFKPVAMEVWVKYVVAWMDAKKVKHSAAFRATAKVIDVKDLAGLPLANKV